MDYGQPALADRLAAEYVTGMLRGPARRRFEKLLPAHPGLRSAVRAWQDRLMPLTAEITPQRPSPALWERIEAKIQGAKPAPEPWWRRLAFWRGFSAIGTAVAVGLALLVVSPGPVQPPIVVVLSAAAAPPGSPAGTVAPASFIASISPDGRAMVTKPLVNVSMEAGRSLELWSLPPQGAPRSLGVIAADKATVVQRGKVLEGTTGFAVSLEPAGGSPTGAPTGPILYVGKLL
jgi:anti-sigma-K factor RskA